MNQEETQRRENERRYEELKEDEVKTTIDDQNIPPNLQGVVSPNDTPGTTVGATVGCGAVAVGLKLTGLSLMGPVAGGWFAANMGAGLAAGSGMATLQSTAMTSAAYCAGGIVGG
eukprot:gene17040-19494_t